MTPYQFNFFHREKVNDGTLISRDIYRFKTRFNRVYFIEIERYISSLYAAKFYLREHKNLADRYKKIIGDNDAFRILSTCVAIAEKISQEDNMASFGFIGVNSLGEKVKNNKRYRIYSTISARYFSPDTYDHFKEDRRGIYFLLKKDNPEIDVQKVNDTLNEYYLPHLEQD